MIRRYRRNLLIAAAFAGFLTGRAQAGPPLICHPFEIGNETSLPWASGSSWDSPAPGYDPAKLSGDTLRLLSSDKPVLARMETLRRAAIYGARQPQVAAELAVRLLARAMREEGNALAAFDAGYYLESLRQMNHISKNLSLADIRGYEWMERSISRLSDKAAGEYALALASSERGWPNAHFRAAVEGAKEGSLLATNLLKHGRKKSLKDLRAELSTVATR